MAMKINAEGVKRGDLPCIPPDQIEVKLTLNGRWDGAVHTEDDINSMVASFERVGQLQAVQVRRIADNRVQLTVGYRRWAAAVEFNKRHPNQQMLLKCTVTDMNEEEALAANVEENKERKSTTPMDDAFAQRRFREDFSWSEDRIAIHYGVSASYISQLRKLLTLPREVQLQVHAGTLSVGLACSLARLPSDEQAVAIQTAKASGEGISTKTVTTAIREIKAAAHEEEQANPTPEPPAAPVTPDLPGIEPEVTSTGEPAPEAKPARKKAKNALPRTQPEIKTFFYNLESDPHLGELATTILDFCVGSITDERMLERLRGLIPVPIQEPIKEAS